MAVSGVGSSNSIYGTRNVITGLASGMDTESMIENAISAYKNKITSLSQKRIKTEWKQEAYQSIINKMSTFMDKYTSYRSSNNLMSTSFFDSAVKTVAKGKYADLISATGRASSSVQVDRVRQLATASVYKLSGTALDGQTADFGAQTVTASAAGTLDLDQEMQLSKFSGSMTLAYGGSNSLSYLSINFDETKTYADAQELADEINRQLEEQTVNIGSKSYTGKELVNNVLKAEVDANGNISFADPKHNNVYIANASDSVKTNLLGGAELSSTYGEQVKSFKVDSSALETRTMNAFDYLSSKGSMEIVLDGVTRTVSFPGEGDIAEGLTGKERDAAYVKALQANIDKAFGPGKLTVSDKNGDGDGIQFQFSTAQKGSTFSISSSQGETLGFGESERITSYLNTGKTLGELLKGKDFGAFELAYTEKTDADGNKVKELAKDAKGNQLYSFRVNGKEIGQFNEDTTLSTVFNTMNSNSDSGVKVNYSRLTNELTFTSKDTGAASQVDFSNPENVKGASLAATLFGVPGTYDSASGSTYTRGQDAILEVSVNGTSLGEITRSSNSVELDGMTINLKGTFGYMTDEDGKIKYEDSGEKTYAYDRNEAGQIVFKGDGGREVYGEERSDGTVALTSKGIDLKYKPADDTNPYAGSAVYGKFNKETGALDFYMKDKDGGNEKQVYLQQGNWFSTTKNFNGNPSVDFKTAVTEEPVMKPVEDKKAEAVTFESSSDSDKIVDVVKQMVADYNEMVTEIKNAYSTLPAQRSNGAYYEPLTAEEEEGQTESFIKNWNDKAKQGILFGESDLRSLYQRLNSAVSLTGESGSALRAAGITVTYSNGLSTLDFDEDKFRKALDDNPEKVRDAFTASTESGAKSNGLMQALKQPLDMYGKTSGGKGLLVEKAGSPLAPSSMYSNSIQKELDRIDEQIERWEDKMNDQIDRYTSQFSRLEQLIQQMNSQSSYFSQLMGG